MKFDLIVVRSVMGHRKIAFWASFDKYSRIANFAIMPLGASIYLQIENLHFLRTNNTIPNNKYFGNFRIDFFKIAGDAGVCAIGC